MEKMTARRASGTKAAIVDAFSRLLLRRQRRIRVADVVAEAGIGRSTFYDHFSGAEQVHLAALSRPFSVLADAAAGRGDQVETARLLRHFWENRGRARDTLMGRMGEQAHRLLAGMIEERLEPPFVVAREMVASQLAGATLALLRSWVTAEAPATADVLAAAICSSSHAMLGALRPPS